MKDLFAAADRDFGSRGRVYLELVVEILSGGPTESKLGGIMKDPKGGKAGGKDGKTPAGGGGAAGAADESKTAAAEVLPVEPPPEV